MSEEAGVPEENPRVQAGDPPPSPVSFHMQPPPIPGIEIGPREGSALSTVHVLLEHPYWSNLIHLPKCNFCVGTSQAGIKYYFILI